MYTKMLLSLNDNLVQLQQLLLPRKKGDAPRHNANDAPAKGSFLSELGQLCIAGLTQACHVLGSDVGLVVPKPQVMPSLLLGLLLSAMSSNLDDGPNHCPVELGPQATIDASRSNAHLLRPTKVVNNGLTIGADLELRKGFRQPAHQEDSSNFSCRS